MDNGEHRNQIEDELQQRNVFVNGISGKPAHSDAYMTVIDIEAFDKAWEEIKDMATREQWLAFCEDWIYYGYLTPTLKLLGLWTKRKVEAYFTTEVSNG
jgi:hypothetical protein